MKNTACLMTIVGMSFLLAGCSSPSRTDGSCALGGSPHRATASALEPDAVGQVLMVEFWSMECLDPGAPEVAALLGQLPGGVLLPGMLGTEAITAYLDALYDRGLLEIRSKSVLTLIAGEGGEIRLTEVVDRPDLQHGVEPGEGLFPFEIGERIKLETAIDDKGFIHLDLDYRLETLQGDIAYPLLPGVLTTAIGTSFVVESGQSVVLGGQWLPRESADGEQTESVLLVVVNARAIASSRFSRAVPRGGAVD